MDLSNMTSSQKDELMDQVKQQIAIANTQEFISVKKNLAHIYTCVTSHIFSCFFAAFCRKSQTNVSKNVSENPVLTWIRANRNV